MIIVISQGGNRLFAVAECDFPPQLSPFFAKIKLVNRMLEAFNKGCGLMTCKQVLYLHNALITSIAIP